MVGLLYAESCVITFLFKFVFNYNCAKFPSTCSHCDIASSFTNGWVFFFREPNDSIKSGAFAVCLDIGRTTWYRDDNRVLALKL